MSQSNTNSQNEDIKTWLKNAQRSVEWFITAEEVMVICSHNSAASRLWRSLDWSHKQQPRIGGKLISIWAEGRHYASSVDVIVKGDRN